MACVRQPQSQYCFLYMTLIISLLLQNVLATSTTPPMSLPNCPDKCGNITIPYPFGIGSKCSRDDEFLVTCNKTNPPKALVGSESSTIELIDINISSGQAHVYKYIAFRCYSQMDQIYKSYNESVINLTGTPYLFSDKHNKFTAIGCDTFVGIMDMPYFSGCLSTCSDGNHGTISDGESCNGYGCCQAPIPPGLNYYQVMWVGDNNSAWLTNPCLYAVLVEENWYKFQKKDLAEDDFLLSNPNGVPIVLDWAIRKNGTCLQDGVEESSKPVCLSKNSICYNTTNGDGYLCNCSEGFEGNPYLPDGCIDIDECKFPDKYPCYGYCANTEGHYQCHCPKGLIGNAATSNCTKHEEFPWRARVVIFSVLSVAIFLGLCFLIATRLQHKKHTKEKEEYQRYYDMMDNYLRVFSKKQIEIATNNFDENRVLGAGGHGKVYKGYLEDNQPVAIKRSKEVEEDQRAEFVNEILLSKINHKNIVRLLGCCIEVDIPMLVYEFISNGALDDLLHGKGKNRPIPLHTRLNIALESADALDYLHSTVSHSILHGDVKSANILLEENYHVKVSDFGASNLVPTDDTQVVKVVQGTRGYVDPEYVATAILTKKSDVYSFGVVLLELITRKCAIFTDEKHERKHLASCFISSVSKNKLHELLDKDIVTTNEKVTMILQEVSELAIWCLSVRGEDRPTMSQVKEKLQNLVKLYNSVLGPEAVEEEKQSLLSAPTSYFTSDSSAFHSTTGSSVLEIEPRVPR